MYPTHHPNFILRDPRHEAVALRRHGVTYDEILERYGIAKSTLWRWLKAEGLVADQPHQLTELRLAAQKRGAEAQRQKRLRTVQRLLQQGIAEVGTLSVHDLWLIGTALYWAEGSKQRVGVTTSQRVVFSNTDPRMLRVFLLWLIRCCHVAPEAIAFEIYLHETADATAAKQWWLNEMRHSAIATCPIRWKRHNPSPRRYNIGRDYHGLLRINVRQSTDLNRKIAGWISGLAEGARLGSGVTGSTPDFGSGSSGSN